MNTAPLILDIKSNSLDDGPGIRTVVFFKGCPLNCVWCHNPESKKRNAELSYDPGKCLACGRCMTACPSDAISQNNHYYINREKCSLCFLCVNACPSDALSRTGSSRTTDEIVKIIIKDKPFFNNSGGGVTLSGGEPTVNMGFTAELMKELKNADIRILIETCGFFNFDNFKDQIYPYLDMIYFDMKIIDHEDHKKYCGVSNDLILQNFIKLNYEYNNGGIEIIPRTPLIPDITDTEKNISAIADFYNKNNVKKAALLSYNPLWHEKNTKLGISNPYSNLEIMTSWISREKEIFCRKIFNDAGIEVVNN